MVHANTIFSDVSVEQPSMTDGSGNVVPYDASSVTTAK